MIGYATRGRRILRPQADYKRRHGNDDDDASDVGTTTSMQSPSSMSRSSGVDSGSSFSPSNENFNCSISSPLEAANSVIKARKPAFLDILSVAN